MKKILFPVFLCFAFGSRIHAQTNPVAQSLTYTQNFGTTTFSSAPSGCAAWTANGSPIGTQTDAENSTNNGDATISTATVVQTTGGCYGLCPSSNGRFYIQTSSSTTDGTDQLACAINTTGWSSISVSYDIGMISVNPRTMGIVLQYRIGTSGAWTSVSGSVYAHNNTDRSNGNVDHFTSLSLPYAANNCSIVQLRWATWRGSETGNSTGIVIDNISISATCDLGGASNFASAIPTEQQTTLSKWYTFTAQNTHATIGVYEIQPNLSNKMLSAVLCSGTCGNATRLLSDTITSTSDSILELNATGLTIGNTYYLQINKSASTGTINYNVSVDYALATLCTGDNIHVADSCNLVFNGDFEFNGGHLPYDASNPGQIVFACPWDEPSGGSSDYFVAGALPICDVPNNFRGTEAVRAGGSAYGGFIVYGTGTTWVTGYHEYIYQELKHTLIAGVRYNLTYYVNLADTSYYSVSKIGACLTSASPTFAGDGQFPIPSGSRTFLNTSGFISDKTGWTRIDTDFVATGNESYIIIGDFGSNNPSNVHLERPLPSPLGSFTPESYYYIDDISLTPYNDMTITSDASISCPGQPVGLSNSVSATIDWAPFADIDLSPIDFAVATVGSTATTFSGTITYCDGCRYTAYTTVQVYHANAGRDTILCPGESTTLNGTGGGTYSWAPSTGLSATNIANPVASPTVTTTYVLTVVGDGLCTSRDTVTVFVENLAAPIIASIPACAGTASTYTITNYNSSNTYNIVLFPISPSPGTVGALNTTTGTFTVNWNTSAGGALDVQVTSPNGCINDTGISVTADFCECSGTIITSSSWDTGTGFGLSSASSPYALYFDADVPSGSNLTLTDDEITIAPGKTITVEAGATLTLDNCHLHSCTDMWGGIVVVPGGYLNIIDGTLIEDATNAVYTVATTGSDIPNLYIDGAIFNKNGIAININDNPNDMSGNVITNTIFTCRTLPGPVAPVAGSFSTIMGDFASNSLTSYTPATTIAGSRSQIGVSFTNAEPPTYGPDYYANVESNMFDNLDEGVSLVASECNIENNTFQNMLGNEIIACHACSASPTGVGIYAPVQLELTHNEAIIHNNYFVDCFRGIDISNYDIINAGSNYFLCSYTPSPFPSSSPTIAEMGIYLKDIRKEIHLTDNTLSNLVTGIWIVRNTTTSGILVPLIQIASNDIEADAYGYCTQAIFLMDATSGLRLSDPMDIYRNYIYDVENGIKVIGIENNLRIYENQAIALRYNASATQAGISIERCDLTEIKNNSNISSLRGTYGSTDNWDLRGIYVYKSQHNKIECNNLFSLGQCMTFEGNCTSTSSGPTGYGVLNNTMDNSRTGILLLNSGIIGQQGSSSSASGNQWSGATYSDGETNVSSSSPSLSPLYCNSADLPTSNAGSPPYSIASSTLFTTSGSTIVTCPVARMAESYTNSDTTNSTMQISSDAAVRLYPNPNNGSMTLEYTLAANEKGVLNIYDLTGKLMEVHQLNENTSKSSIETTYLPSGVYMYEVIINDKKVKTDKLIIIR